MRRRFELDRMSRRDALQLLGATGLVALAGCDSATVADLGDASGGELDGDFRVADDIAAETGSEAVYDGPWATGGTSSMGTRPASPFTEPATDCAIVGGMTEGPCTTSKVLEREDISEGWAGLPVWLALRVVDSACVPRVGAQVRLWHTNLEGSYSGQTPNNAMCLLDSDYAFSDFFRGSQETDKEGVVWFKTCFPGWYKGRAIHIHFQVFENGSSTKVSQLFFPEETIVDVFENHEDYAVFGQPDTPLSADNVAKGLSGDERAQLILDVAALEGGILLASQTVAVV